MNDDLGGPFAFIDQGGSGDFDVHDRAVHAKHFLFNEREGLVFRAHTLPAFIAHFPELGMDELLKIFANQLLAVGCAENF